MKHIFYLLFIVLSVPVTAQISKVDSLETELRKATSDTSKINLMTGIGMEIWASAPEKTLNYAQKSLALSQKIKYRRGEANSYQGLGVYYWQKNDYKKSIAHYAKSQKIYTEINDKTGAARIVSNIGMVHADQGNYSQALENYLQALAVFQGLNDQKRSASTINSIGNVHKNQQNYDEALIFYKQAQAIWIKLGDQTSLAGSYNNIATIYTKQKNYKAAIATGKKSLEIFDRIKNVNGQIICHNNLGEAYFLTGEFSAAKLEYEKALELNEKFQSKKLLVSSYNGLGHIFAKTGENSNAIQSYREVIELASVNKLRPALQLAYDGLATVYGQTNDFSNAFKYQRLSTVLKDSLFNAENTIKMANLRVHYENERKQTELKLLQNEKELGYATRNTIVIGLIAVLILVALAFNRQRLKIQKNRELHAAQQALAEIEIRNSAEKEQQLRNELDFRNKALTTHTLNLIQKNSILEEIRQTISLALKSGQRDENTPLFSRLINLIDYSFNLDKDWDEFKMYFEGVHKDFFSKLKKDNPELSAGELRLCALVRLNLNLKESATLLNISPDSVKTARHRLRKKLNLPEDSNLSDYLMTI